MPHSSSPSLSCCRNKAQAASYFGTALSVCLSLAGWAAVALVPPDAVRTVAGAAALGDLATPSSPATWAWGPGGAVLAAPAREVPLEFVSPPRQILALRSPLEAPRVLAPAPLGPPPVSGLLAPGCPGPLAEARKDWLAGVAQLPRGQGPALLAVEIHP